MSNIAESPRHSILVSMGEPAGIGPEVAVKAWAALGGRARGRAIRLIGSAGVFHAPARFCGIDPNSLRDAVIDTEQAVRAMPGKPSKENAKAVTEAIAQGVRAVEAGKAAALNFLKGQVMRLSKGKANPALVGEILERKLRA